MNVVLALVACAVGERTMVVEEPVSAVFVALSSGEISVISVEREGVFLDHEGWCLSEDEGGTGLEIVDGELFFGGEGRDCGGELYVEVPLGTPVAVALDRGEVDVELRAPADLSVCAAAGEVSVVVPAGEYVLDLDLGAGELWTSGIEGSERAEHRIGISLAAGEVSLLGI